MEIISVRLDQLVSVGNIRHIQDGPELDELVKSMAEGGQEVEIHVFPYENGYAIKFGHRRVEAARRLGWETIRAVVDPVPPPDELILAQYTENQARENLRYLDKAGVYAALKDLGWSQRRIAQKFNVSDADVSLALAALRADPKLQQAINEGSLAPSAVEPLLSQPAEVQAALADAAIRAKTVRQVAALVKAYKNREDLAERETPVHTSADDVDPLEEMAVGGLREALEHLRLAEQARIQHPELVRQARPTVEQLLRTAQSLKKYLDGSGYDDLADLA
jgi:ParB/RepB/Spo0J family partition protein